MKKITDIGHFSVSVEIVPPRNGRDPSTLFEQLGNIKDKIDFISVTKGAGGSLRGGSFPISHIANSSYGLNVVPHLVCRERNRYELENEIVDLHYFGMKNILALRGDPPAGSDQHWSGEYHYAYRLAEQVRNMNHGIYLPLQNDDSPRTGLRTDFCIIVAGHPEDQIKDEIRHLRCKINAGASLVITQMVFSFEEFRSYFEGLRSEGIDIPVIAGIRPLVNLNQARATETFFGLKVNERLKQGLGGDSARDFGVGYTIDMIRRLKECGAFGAHLFVLSDLELAGQILSGL
ncbi:MAG: methylenetetrahydrofolate reductase [archaeon]